MEPRTSGMVGRCSATEPHPNPVPTKGGILMQEKTSFTHPRDPRIKAVTWGWRPSLAESVRGLRSFRQQTWRWRCFGTWPGLTVMNITGSKDDSDSDLIPAQTPGKKLTSWKMWELNCSWYFFLLPDALHQSVTTFYASYSIMEGFWDYANRDESTRDISLNRMRLCRLPPPSKEESNTIQIQQSLKEDSSPACELGSRLVSTHSLQIASPKKELFHNTILRF